MGCAASQDETFSLEDLGVSRGPGAPNCHMYARSTEAIHDLIHSWKKNVRAAKMVALAKDNIAKRLENICMADVINTWRNNMGNRLATNARLYQEQVAFIGNKSSKSRQRINRIERIQVRNTLS